ncbi:hypothetical protein K458DRAFT_370230 [Lentithecium fluviatile CBS 122367]|uniref:Symplekin/Pta1 N-terminal domain-containing protein n=1 Tax=Lentithecium fluviatile CBS 122367 TaxID=1168545 RepID=A0A6G1IVW5_9PLEO|nr:hypothetical protein K458DRAFT_370230 [Lentithecium fluviatile CBS 122367]
MHPSLEQLENARSLALGDGRYYSTIVPGVMPIIGVQAPDTTSIEVRRWGADFLAETFASPTWAPEEKARLALTVLETLKLYLDTVQDRGVIKSAIQAAASIYPLVYRHIVSDRNDSHHWQLMLAIKSNILRQMDSAPSGVRICCVKFVQQVVLVQTPSVVDPRRSDPNDISLNLVPRDHPLMPYTSLEAEGQGLLDRLLGIIHGDHSDALLVTAVLNSLGTLIQRRPAVANKILTSVFNFNPLKLANAPMTSKNKVMMKSIERTTRSLLVNVIKRNPENPNNGRIHQFLETMHQRGRAALDETNRKRPAPVEPTDGLDPSKRMRLAAQPPGAGPSAAPAGPPPVAPLPPGPVSYRQLYTLNAEGNKAAFDVQMFQDPEQLLRILVPVLQSIDEVKLGHAINAVRSRYLALSKAAPNAAPAPATAPDDEDEYEPDFEPEDAEQVVNRLDGLSSTDNFPIPAAPLAPYKLPEVPPLTQQEVQVYGNLAVRQAFEMLAVAEEKEKSKTSKGGFNRLAASDFGRDAWITILSRLATRASAGLDDPDEGIKDEFVQEHAKGSLAISETVREGLLEYVMKDWKKRLDIAISWLNEEWYNDTVMAESARMAAKANNVNGNASRVVTHAPKSNYQTWALRLLDRIIVIVEYTDKILLRLLSEMPALDHEILRRIKKMAEDPERIDLACMVLQYLYMFRPPVRDLVVEVLTELWRENDRAKPSAAKWLNRWNPAVLQEEANGTAGNGGEVKMENGVGKESANGAFGVKAAL